MKPTSSFPGGESFWALYQQVTTLRSHLPTTTMFLSMTATLAENNQSTTQNVLGFWEGDFSDVQLPVDRSKVCYTAKFLTNSNTLGPKFPEFACLLPEHRSKAEDRPRTLLSLLLHSFAWAKCSERNIRNFIFLSKVKVHDWATSTSGVRKQQSIAKLLWFSKILYLLVF